MTSNDKNCLLLRQSPDVHWLGGQGYAPLEIVKFTSSEIAGSSYFSIYCQESLIRN